MEENQKASFNTFKELLVNIQKRPGMYFLPESLSNATNLVQGMDLMLEFPIFRSFSSWLLLKKLKIEKSACGWPVLIEIYMEQEGITETEEQIDIFFKFLFEFFEDEGLWTKA